MGEIEPPPALVPMRQLQAFFTPDSLDLLVIDGPAFDAQELADLAVAVAAILFGQPDQARRRSSSCFETASSKRGIASLRKRTPRFSPT